MITYPVDVEKARFTVKLGADVKRNVRWPRGDGMPVENADPSLIILEQSVAPLPEYDPKTHKLDNGQWVDDEQNQTAVWTRTAIPLTAEELGAVQLFSVLEAKRTLVKQAIPTLRDWSTQAAATTATTNNAVTVLNAMLDNLAVFYDRFADLLEVLRIDQ